MKQNDPAPSQEPKDPAVGIRREAGDLEYAPPGEADFAIELGDPPPTSTAADELDALLERSLPSTPLLRSNSLGDLQEGASRRPSRRLRGSMHHRRRTSMEMVWMSLSEGLERIAEGMQAEAELLQGTLHKQLQDADEGRTYFLDMSLTRSLSVVPEDLADLASETTVGAAGPVPPEVPPEVHEGPALGRYIALLGAVLAVSSNGTALSLLNGVEPALKLFWRMTATALMLSFFAVRSTWKAGLPSLTSWQWLHVLGAVVCYTAHALLFYEALSYTSIGLVVMFANSQALILVLGRVVLGHEVELLEIGGVLVASMGAAFCAVDEVEDPDQDTTDALKGNLMALGSGVTGVAYLTFARSSRPHLTVTAFMCLVMAAGSILVLLFILATDKYITVSRDPFHGLFGWMTAAEHRIVVLLHIALVCNVLGTMGFVRAMQYFDNIIIAVATLLEPMTATLIAAWVGVGDLPGVFGWAGNALVAMGTLCVVYPSVHKPMEH